MNMDMAVQRVKQQHHYLEPFGLLSCTKEILGVQPQQPPSVGFSVAEEVEEGTGGPQKWQKQLFGQHSLAALKNFFQLTEEGGISLLASSVR